MTSALPSKAAWRAARARAVLGFQSRAKLGVADHKEVLRARLQRLRICSASFR